MWTFLGLINHYEQNSAPIYQYRSSYHKADNMKSRLGKVKWLQLVKKSCTQQIRNMESSLHALKSQLNKIISWEYSTPYISLFIPIILEQDQCSCSKRLVWGRIGRGYKAMKITFTLVCTIGDSKPTKFEGWYIYSLPVFAMSNRNTDTKKQLTWSHETSKYVNTAKYIWFSRLLDGSRLYISRMLFKNAVNDKTNELHIMNSY
jgi:hypothetical protein